MTERTTGIENEPLEFQEEWLSAYLDGELTSEQRSAVEARLQYDSNVQQMLLDLQKVRSLVAGLPEWPNVFGGLRDFQVPEKFDDSQLAEPPPAAGDVLLKSAQPVEELEPLSENTTFDAPKQNEIEEPASPPLQMQSSEELLSTGQEPKDTEATETAPKESEPLPSEEQADSQTEPPSLKEHLEAPEGSISESIGTVNARADDSLDSGEDVALERQQSELVAPVRDSDNYLSDHSNPSMLPRLATAASLLAMLGLGYFLWEPIAGSLFLASGPESFQADDSLPENASRRRPESDDKSPAAPGTTIEKKPENLSDGEAADSAANSVDFFGMAGGGRLRSMEPEAQLPSPPLEQSRLPEPSDSQMDKTVNPLPTGGIPPAMAPPKVQSRRMQSGFGGIGGRPEARALGGGGGGLPLQGMRQTLGGRTPNAPGSAAPKMLRLDNGVAGESKSEATESAAPVMEMAPAETRPLSESEQLAEPAPFEKLATPARAGPAGLGGIASGTTSNQPATVAGTDTELLPQLHLQTKIPLGRYEVLSDGTWSLDEMKESLLRLKNRPKQSDAPEAAIGAFEGTTEIVVEQILEDTAYQQLSHSLVQRGRQSSPGEAMSNDFSEAATATGQQKEKRSSPAKPILLFTRRATAEKLLQSKSISKATGEYLWLRNPNGRENPADKVLLLLNPK